MNDMTNPPLGTPESARDIVQTIALAMKRGYTPNEILDENSPIAERIWAEAMTVRPPIANADAQHTTVDEDDIL